VKEGHAVAANAVLRDAAGDVSVEEVEGGDVDFFAADVVL
jgi:hypothetical protein